MTAKRIIEKVNGHKGKLLTLLVTILLGWLAWVSLAGMRVGVHDEWIRGHADLDDARWDEQRRTNVSVMLMLDRVDGKLDDVRDRLPLTRK